MMYNIINLMNNLDLIWIFCQFHLHCYLFKFWHGISALFSRISNDFDSSKYYNTVRLGNLSRFLNSTCKIHDEIITSLEKLHNLHTRVGMTEVF